jgi:hypothetical protein
MNPLQCWRRKGGSSLHYRVKSPIQMEVNMAEAHKRAHRHPKYKTSYRIKNWPVYEKSLQNRGDITFWISQDAINAWMPLKNGKRVGQPIYSDIRTT